MKILATIPVERVSLTSSTYTFRTEEMEVEVVRLLRSPCGEGAAAKRYFYQADVKRPACMHPEAPCWQKEQGLTRVSIVRTRNPKWKPPVFPAGVNVITFEDQQ